MHPIYAGELPVFDFLKVQTALFDDSKLFDHDKKSFPHPIALEASFHASLGALTLAHFSSYSIIP